MKKHISFNLIFLIVYFSIFIISIIFTVIFGRLLYLLTSLTLLVFILYFINISKKKRSYFEGKNNPFYCYSNSNSIFFIYFWISILQTKL